MMYEDRIFGKVEINEPVILELIDSPSLQRLKGIDQAGYPPLWTSIPEKILPLDNKRFSHSVGVYLWLKKYGAPFEEQIAGLIHDVSHSAFSHTIDYILEKGEGGLQGHQDSIFEDYVRKTEIPRILEKYKINVDYILGDHNFPLKEKELPDLCADRLDYCLRDTLFFKEASREEADYLLANLKTENGRWIFNNLESAKKFAMIFWKMNNNCYSHHSAAYMFACLVDHIRHALMNNYVTMEDLYTTDKDVLDKIALHHNSDSELAGLFKRLNTRDGYVLDDKKFDHEIVCKSRMVDPLCHHEGRIIHLSEADKEIAEIFKTALKPKVYYIRYI